MTRFMSVFVVIVALAAVLSEYEIVRVERVEELWDEVMYGVRQPSPERLDDVTDGLSPLSPQIQGDDNYLEVWRSRATRTKYLIFSNGGYSIRGGVIARRKFGEYYFEIVKKNVYAIDAAILGGRLHWGGWFSVMPKNTRIDIYALKYRPGELPKEKIFHSRNPIRIESDMSFAVSANFTDDSTDERVRIRITSNGEAAVHDLYRTPRDRGKARSDTGAAFER